jgi:hypothetical protein
VKEISVRHLNPKPKAEYSKMSCDDKLLGGGVIAFFVAACSLLLWLNPVRTVSMLTGSKPNSSNKLDHR